LLNFQQPNVLEKEATFPALKSGTNTH